MRKTAPIWGGLLFVVVREVREIREFREISVFLRASVTPKQPRKTTSI